MGQLARIAVSLVVCLSLAGVACASQHDGSSFRYEDPLLWAHLVVKGHVEAVAAAPSTTAEWGIDMGGPVDSLIVERISVRVSRVLKGSLEGASVTVAAFQRLRGSHGQPFSVGDEVILAPYFNVAAGEFHLRSYRGLLVARHGDWMRPDPLTYRYRIDVFKMSDAELMTRIQSVSVPAVVENAALIIEGKILSVASEKRVEGVFTRWTMSIDSILKGEHSERTVSFAMLSSGVFDSWAAPVPETRVGETWIVHLSHHNSELVPFAGFNGMLLVKGEDLIYDRVVNFPLTRTNLKSVIKAVVE